MQRALLPGIVLFLVLLFAGISHAGPVIGGFNSARGGYYSFPVGGYLTDARTSLSAHFPGSSYASFPELTPQNLSGIDILMLSVATSNTSAISPLSTSEQSALLSFVKDGGCAILFPDNSTFSGSAPAVNESMIDAFGMNSAGTLYGWVAAPVRSDGSPVTDGRFGKVSTLYQNYPGGLTNLGPYAVPAASNPLGTALAYIESGAIAPGSGRVVVYTDVNSFGNSWAAGQYYSNETIFLNTIDYCTQPLIGGACIQPPSGMVGWWPGDGTAYDATGTNHGTEVNGVPYVDGKVGKAFSFNDAQLQHVAIPHRPELDLTTSLTIDMWVMKKGGCEDLNCWLVAKGNKDYSFDTQKGRYGLFISDASYWPASLDNRVGLSFNTGSWQDVVMGTTMIENDVWYHVAGTWDGTDAKVYVNGELENSVPKTGSILPTTEEGSLTIGAEIFGDWYLPNGEHFDGLIDEVEIYNRALSADEIKAIYRAGSAGKCKPVNRKPVAKAAAAVTECSAPVVTPVLLDGSGSMDPDNDPMTYAWEWAGGSTSGVAPTALFPLGTTSVTLTVSDGKGETSSNMIEVLVEDTTAPATTAAVSGTTGMNGWYVTDVGITLISSDTCTGVKEIHYTINGVETVVAGSFAAFTLSKDGSYVITYWAVDNNGREGTRGSTPVYRDTAPPVTIPELPAPPSDGGGSYRSCVPVTLTTTAGESGVAEVLYSLDNGRTWLPYTGAFTICYDGPTTISYKAVSNAGNVEESKTIVINIDQTPPTIIGTATPAANASGWNNTDVVVGWSCSDSGSGVAFCPASATFTAEVAGQVITREAVDNAGNRSTASVTVNIDKTLPTITAAASPAANGYGWNNGDVTVTFSCNDTGAGIAACTEPVTMSGEGNQQGVIGTATDKAGNTAIIEVKINIDRTGPAIVITGVIDGETYPVCSAPKPAFATTDPLSGILSQQGVLTGGNENGVNVFTYTVTASDQAENTSTSRATYRVAYGFGGFLAPVTLAKPFKKGSTIPVKFTLTDGCGNSVTTAKATLTLTPMFGTVEDAEPIDATSNVPDSGNMFRYSGSDGIYIYNLATDGLAVGTYLATVTTDDGVVNSIPIQIKQ